MLLYERTWPTPPSKGCNLMETACLVFLINNRFHLLLFARIQGMGRGFAFSVSAPG